ncbi:response regulator [Nocardia sp. NPDC051981]|uniref:response regulator n=1 Tax=Nocardia sp. NPDC051981 TaxID=3155417 RepID=UPI0034148E10
MTDVVRVCDSTAAADRTSLSREPAGVRGASDRDRGTDIVSAGSAAFSSIALRIRLSGPACEGFTISQFPYSATEFTQPPIPAARPSKVLVVESNPAMAEIEVLVLANAGHEVISAPSAQRALHLARRWKPDLVLLELDLPDLPGAHLCRQLRNRSPIPIIAVSLDGDPDAIGDAYTAGACDYLLSGRRSSRLRVRRDTAGRRLTHRDPAPPSRWYPDS